MRGFTLQPKVTWAAFGALLRSNPSTDQAAATEVRVVDAHRLATRLPLRDWHQNTELSPHEARTLRQEAAFQLANAKLSEFRFTVNQGTMARVLPGA